MQLNTLFFRNIKKERRNFQRREQTEFKKKKSFIHLDDIKLNICRIQLSFYLIQFNHKPR